MGSDPRIYAGCGHHKRRGAGLRIYGDLADPPPYPFLRLITYTDILCGSRAIYHLLVHSLHVAEGLPIGPVHTVLNDTIVDDVPSICAGRILCDIHGADLLYASQVQDHCRTGIDLVSAGRFEP